MLRGGDDVISLENGVLYIATKRPGNANGLDLVEPLPLARDGRSIQGRPRMFTDCRCRGLAAWRNGRFFQPAHKKCQSTPPRTGFATSLLWSTGASILAFTRVANSVLMTGVGAKIIPSRYA